MILTEEFFMNNHNQVEILSKLTRINLNIDHVGLDVPLLTEWRSVSYSSSSEDHKLVYDGHSFCSVSKKKHRDVQVREYIENKRDDNIREVLDESPRKDLHEEEVWYQCKTCGNRALVKNPPNNEVCGGCDDAEWLLSKKQTSYIEGRKDWIHPDGEI